MIEIFAQELYNGYGSCSEGTGKDEIVEISSWLYDPYEDPKKYAISTQIKLVELSTEWYNAKTNEERTSIAHLLEAIKRATDDDIVDRFAESALNTLFGGGIVSDAILSAAGCSEAELDYLVGNYDGAQSSFYMRLSVNRTNDVTPGGRTFTTHGAERANERGFSPDAIDRIVDNNKAKRVVKNGEITYEHVDARGNKIVLNDKGGIVSVHSSAYGGKYIPKPKLTNGTKIKPKK